MKNLYDESQFTDRERAFENKAEAKKLSRYGDLKGKVSLTIPRLRATYFFKSKEDLKEKRSRYELFEGEGKVKI